MEQTKLLCDAMSFLFSKCQNMGLAKNINDGLLKTVGSDVADHFWILANRSELH